MFYNKHLSFSLPWGGKNIFISAISWHTFTLIDHRLLAAVMEFVVDFSLDISKTHLKALESSGDTASSKHRHVDILCLIIRGTARIKRQTPCLHQVGGAHASQVLVHWCTHLIFHNFSLREVLRNCLMYISHLIISCIRYLYHVSIHQWLMCCVSKTPMAH